MLSPSLTVLLCDSTWIVTFSVGSVKVMSTFNSFRKTLHCYIGHTIFMAEEYMILSSSSWRYSHTCKNNRSQSRFLHFCHWSKCNEATWFHFLHQNTCDWNSNDYNHVMYLKKPLMAMNSSMVWFHFETLTCSLWSSLFGGLQQSEKQLKLSMPCISTR